MESTFDTAGTHAATFDDPGAQRAFTTWAVDAAGVRVARSQFRLTGLVCAACAGPIETALRAEPGVIDADVSCASRRATVRWHPGATRPTRLLAGVERSGYGAAPDLAEPARALRRAEERSALWRLFVAVFCAIQVMMYAAPAYVAAPGTLAPDLLRLLQWASWLLGIPVLAFSAAPIFRAAWAGLRRRQARMDLPVAIGLLVTFLASSAATYAPGGAFGDEVYVDSLTMLVGFLLAGRSLTLRAQQRVAAALGFATYGNAGCMREQVCKYMCPYARFQSAMSDRDTLVISDDTARGEPRGSRPRGVAAASVGKGDFIDCTLCVQVCPTGIDIRDGLQYECIGCTACIDVCNGVMDKMGSPRGLIRYATQNGMQGGWSRARMWRRVLRPRVLVYAAVLGLIGAGFIASLALRAPFRADVVRDRGALARLGGGAHPMRFRITLQRGGGSGGAVLVEKSTFVVPR